MNTRNIILATAAVIVVIGVGVYAHLDPAFRDTATEIGIVLLGLVVVGAVVGVLVAPLLRYLTRRVYEPRTALLTRARP